MRSEYSDMSMRIRFFSSPNTASASALESSVLPTPVGPRNRNVPIGRFGSWRPTRPLRIAFATAVTASSWPITRLWSLSSSFKSLVLSFSVSLDTGTWDQRETTFATSPSVTFRLFASFFSLRASAFCAPASTSSYCLRKAFASSMRPSLTARASFSSISASSPFT